MSLPVRRLLVAGVSGLALAAATLLPATAASAASATGWVRVAHLSPDTKPVDVSLYALSGGQVEFSLKDVAYGSVSKYVHLDDGTYVVAMQPAGSSSSTPPIVKETVQVTGGSAQTVAVFGRNASLQPKVLTDDLSTPASGTARVRVIQASTAGRPVTVTTAGGPTITSEAADGTVTGYASVPAQTWRLQASSAGGAATTASVTLKNGEIASIVVLDTPGGGLAVRTITDSATVGAQPSGFLATGGGFLARQAEQQQRLAAAALAGLGAVAAAAAAVRLRRRRAVA